MGKTKKARLVNIIIVSDNDNLIRNFRMDGLMDDYDVKVCKDLSEMNSALEHESFDALVFDEKWSEEVDVTKFKTVMVVNKKK